jgi:hypothetical protein
MKQIIGVLITTVITFSAHASIVLYRVSDYRCSNGENYHVVSEHISGYGTTSWHTLYFCSDHILTQSSYNGHSTNAREEQELGECEDQASLSVAICFDEYRSLNNQEGRGAMPAIIHGQ